MVRRRKPHSDPNQSLAIDPPPAGTVGTLPFGDRGCIPTPFATLGDSLNPTTYGPCGHTTSTTWEANHPLPSASPLVHPMSVDPTSDESEN